MAILNMDMEEDVGANIVRPQGFTETVWRIQGVMYGRRF